MLGWGCTPTIFRGVRFGMRTIWLLALLSLAFLLQGCSAPERWQRIDAEHLAPPPLHREMRGVWVATVANIDWPSRPGLTPSEQQAEADAVLDLAFDLGLNAIILQVRPHADALYAGAIEPWSSYLTGTQGRDPGYDPLRHWLDGAHERGLELHAWINPFRAGHPAETSEIATSHVSITQPDLVVEYGSYLWLDPSHPGARAHSLAVVKDLLERYDLDGLHLDDYFYPYPIDDADFPDADRYDAYLNAGGTLGRTEWRRSHINRFVQDLNDVVRRVRPDALFGISPFGIWRPDHPEGVVGFDAYEQLAADSRLWLTAGWIDYASPQLYWKRESEGQPFDPLLRWWQGENPRGRAVWPGLYLTRIQADGSGWSPDEIIGQLEVINERGAGGWLLFSMVGLLQDRQGVASELREFLRGDPAIVPPAWRAQTPRRTKLRVEVINTDDITVVRWRGATPEPRLWVVQQRTSEGWSTRVLPGATESMTFDASSPHAQPDAVVLTPIASNRRAGASIAWIRP